MSRLGERDFGLSKDEMKQIKFMEVLKRRKTTTKKFSENLSMEAQIAMQLAVEDTERLRKQSKEKPQPLTALSAVPENSTGTAPSVISSGQGFSSDNSSKHRPGTSISSNTSYSELFERHQSARMVRDITDSNYEEDKEIKRALGGGKLESAMEIVEVINKDDPDVPVWDDEAILELARTNAVDKCLVWMEATVGKDVEYDEGEFT